MVSTWIQHNQPVVNERDYEHVVIYDSALVSYYILAQVGLQSSEKMSSEHVWQSAESRMGPNINTRIMRRGYYRQRAVHHIQLISLVSYIIHIHT